MGKRFTIGLPSITKAEGPKIFLSRLARSLKRLDLAGTIHFLLPFYDTALFTSYARFCFNKPFFLRLDGIAFDIEERCGTNDKINAPIFKGIDRSCGVIYQSIFNRRLIETFHGVPKHPSIVIPNGIDLNEFGPEGQNFRKKLNIPDEAIVLVTSAVWRAHKRLHDVIAIFKILDKDMPGRFHLLVLGPVPEDSAAHPRIHCPGYIPPTQLPRWYRSADIFVYLSWLDHCPNTVVEALSCGLPVICSNQGGTREIVERANGGIVVAADDLFEFRPVDLYHPPRPDYDMVLQAVDEIVVHIDRYRNDIDRESLKIDKIAHRYVDFMQKCLRHCACDTGC